MHSIISKYDINQFLIWSGFQGNGEGQSNVSNMFSVPGLTKDRILQSNSVQLENGATVRLTQHTTFQLSRRSITLEEVKQTIEIPDEILPDILDNRRKIYKKYQMGDMCLNIMLARLTDGNRLVVGAWVAPV